MIETIRELKDTEIETVSGGCCCTKAACNNSTTFSQTGNVVTYTTVNCDGDLVSAGWFLF